MTLAGVHHKLALWRHLDALLSPLWRQRVYCCDIKKRAKHIWAWGLRPCRLELFEVMYTKHMLERLIYEQEDHSLPASFCISSELPVYFHFPFFFLFVFWLIIIKIIWSLVKETEARPNYAMLIEMDFFKYYDSLNGTSEYVANYVQHALNLQKQSNL